MSERDAAAIAGQRDFNWTREETILAADVYVNRLGRKLPSNDENSEIASLSDLLRRADWHPVNQRKPHFRNRAGVYLKLANLLSVDPERPQKGMSRASDMDRVVMEEFFGRWEALAIEAAHIRSEIANSLVTAPANVEPMTEAGRRTDRKPW